MSLRWRRWASHVGAVAACMLLLALWLAPRPGHAHEFRPGHLTLTELTPSAQHEGTRVWQLDWTPPRYRARGRVMLSGALELRDSRCELLGGAVRGRLVCPSDEAPSGRLHVVGLRGSLAEVVVHVEGRAAHLLSSRRDQLELASLGQGAPALGLDSWTAGVVAGAAHVIGGWDHLAFLVCLVLMVLRAGAPIRPNLARLLAAASLFTLAHALALASMALGARVPAAPLELAIALSIVVVAADLARRPAHEASDTAPVRWTLWAAALGFGYLHGLGFGSALLGSSTAGVWSQLGALVSFNVGVELAQLGFVVAVVAVVALARRVDWRAPARLLVPYGIGTVATAWCFERFGDMF